jgi:hypothetical protein
MRDWQGLVRVRVEDGVIAKTGVVGVRDLSERVEGWFSGIFRLTWSFRCLDGLLGRSLGVPWFIRSHGRNPQVRVYP